MEPHEYLSALRQRWIVIVALALLGGVLGYAYAASITPTYQATSSVFVSTPSGDNTSELLQGQTFTQNLVQSYAQLASTPIVLKPVIAELGLNETAQTLGKSVTADNPLNTVIIDISATDPSPTHAAAVADAVAASLGKTASKLSPKGTNGAASITMAVTSPAQVPLQPIAPKKQTIAITALAVGLAIGIIYALLRHFLDTRVRGDSDVERAGDVAVLGSIVRKRRLDTTEIAMLSSTHGLVAEGYRRVRTNLEFAEVDRRLRSVSVTSAVPGEGKSTFTINLALAMAELGVRVLIIDGDLRKPSIAEYCHLEPAVGLTSVLSGKIGLADAVQQMSENVDVLTSGVVPPNPSQLLGSVAMRQLMTNAGTEYDFIVVDTPPLLPAADALAMSHLTDGTIVIALYNSTRRHQLSRALDGLKAVNSRVLGVVINQAKRELKDEYYSYVHDGAAKGDAVAPAVVAVGPATATANTTEAAAEAGAAQPGSVHADGVPSDDGTVAAAATDAASATAVSSSAAVTPRAESSPQAEDATAMETTAATGSSPAAGLTPTNDSTSATEDAIAEQTGVTAPVGDATTATEHAHTSEPTVVRKSRRIRTRRPPHKPGHASTHGPDAAAHDVPSESAPEDPDRHAENVPETKDRADTEFPLVAELADSERGEGLTVVSP